MAGNCSSQWSLLFMSYIQSRSQPFCFSWQDHLHFNNSAPQHAWQGITPVQPAERTHLNQPTKRTLQQESLCTLMPKLHEALICIHPETWAGPDNIPDWVLKHPSFPGTTPVFLQVKRHFSACSSRPFSPGAAVHRLHLCLKHHMHQAGHHNNNHGTEHTPVQLGPGLSGQQTTHSVRSLPLIVQQC